jgi:hypothetical protein
MTHPKTGGSPACNSGTSTPSCTRSPTSLKASFFGGTQLARPLAAGLGRRVANANRSQATGLTASWRSPCESIACDDDLNPMRMAGVSIGRRGMLSLLVIMQPIFRTRQEVYGNVRKCTDTGVFRLKIGGVRTVEGFFKARCTAGRGARRSVPRADQSRPKREVCRKPLRRAGIAANQRNSSCSTWLDRRIRSPARIRGRRSTRTGASVRANPTATRPSRLCSSRARRRF